MIRTFQRKALASSCGLSTFARHWIPPAIGRHANNSTIATSPARTVPLRTTNNHKTLSVCRWKNTASKSTKKDAEMKSKLHSELQSVIQPKQSSSPPPPKPPGFVDFVKKQKTQFLNIGASFFCVLLAYQIVALRRSGRYRQEQLNLAQRQVQDKQALLQLLTSDEFVSKLAKECASMVLLEQDANNKSSRWSVIGIKQRQLSAHELADKLHPVIHLALSEEIGDAGLNEQQIKERIVEALRNAQVSQTEMDVQEAIAIVEDTDSGETVVQKRVFQM